MKLSIIIPYFNTAEYTKELLDALAPQMYPKVECFVIDDGSTIPFTTDHKWVKVIHKKNGGAASARNMGINESSGDYITFIDSDDMVPEYYVEKVLGEIETTHADVIDFSWKSLSPGGPQYTFKLKSKDEYLKNPSVCTRAFKRSFIGDIRFNEKKEAAEDEDFSRRLGYLEPGDFVHSAITDFMYFYRTSVGNSNVKRFKQGLTRTKRVIYYHPRVTKGMQWLLDEIKKEDEVNEVVLLTNHCEIPELKRYCQIEKPHHVWGHSLKGEPYKDFTLIDAPERADVVLYISKTLKISGINTFIYNFCAEMAADILVVYEEMSEDLISRLKSVARVMKNDFKKSITCETIILNRLYDSIPVNVTYKKSVRICHATNQLNLTLKNDCDYLVCVSEFSKSTWGSIAKDAAVIHNISHVDKDELLLVSATRIQSLDKGANDDRFKKLCDKLLEAGIPFVWLNFSDKPLLNMPENFINMSPRKDIQTFIKRADYLVQLSDNKESFCYSILEALTLGTAVITTKLNVLDEIGMVDGVNGYVVPFDMNFDPERLLTIPKFEFTFDNKRIVEQWTQILEAPGNGIRKGFKAVSVEHEDKVKVRVLKKFKDISTGKIIQPCITYLPRKRVEEILTTEKERQIKLIEVMEG